MAINAFQAGQLANIKRAQEQEILDDQLRKERGNIALGEQFGEAALAPQAFATLRSADRADDIFAADQVQRAFTNKRTTEQDIQNAINAKIIDDRAERIFQSDEKQRGIVNSLADKTFGASQDQLAILNDLAERKYLSEDTIANVKADLERDKFISFENQLIILNAFKERVSDRADVTLTDKQKQQEITNVFKGRAEARADVELSDAQKQQIVTNIMADTKLSDTQKQQEITNVFKDRAETRADQKAAALEEKQKIEDDRNVEQDAIEAAALEQKTKFKVGMAAIGMLKAGAANKVPVEETIDRIRSALGQLGWTEDQIGELPELMRSNPNFIVELEGALKASNDTSTRRVVSRPLPVEVDGKSGVLITYSNGDTEFVPIVTVREKLGAGRLAVQVEKIDPSKAGALSEAKAKAKALGEGKGKLEVEDLPTSRTAIAFQRSKIRSMTDTTDRAIASLDKALTEINNMSTGFIGGVTKFIPGTPGFKLVQRLLPAVSQEFVQNLQNMRDLSKTGGAVGNVSDAEGARLAAINASLDIGVGPKQLIEQIKIMRDAILTSRRNIELAFQQDQEARTNARLLNKYAPLGEQ